MFCNGKCTSAAQQTHTHTRICVNTHALSAAAVCRELHERRFARRHSSHFVCGVCITTLQCMSVLYTRFCAVSSFRDVGLWAVCVCVYYWTLQIRRLRRAHETPHVCERDASSTWRMYKDEIIPSHSPNTFVPCDEYHHGKHRVFPRSEMCNDMLLWWIQTIYSYRSYNMYQIRVARLSEYDRQSRNAKLRCCSIRTNDKNTFDTNTYRLYISCIMFVALCCVTFAQSFARLGVPIFADPFGLNECTVRGEYIIERFITCWVGKLPSESHRSFSTICVRCWSTSESV